MSRIRGPALKLLPSFLLSFISMVVFSGCSGSNLPTVGSTTSPVITTPVNVYTTVPVTTNAAAATSATNPIATLNLTATNLLGTSPAKIAFKADSPVSVFTARDLAYLGINLSGSQQSIAEAIKRWQIEHMVYIQNPAVPQNSSDAIRWNYFLPGIFPSSEIINEHIDNGRVYGICFDYAVIYASIAKYYGLECRIMASKSKPSDTNPNIGPTQGMSPEEYDRLKIKLLKRGLNYPYEAIRLVAEETPTHYWPEVLIDGQWRIFDGSQQPGGADTQVTFKDTGDYSLVDWLSRDRSSQIEKYILQMANTVRLPDPGVPGAGPIPSQTGSTMGMKDDLGQLQRAANIDDLMKGVGLAPYYYNVADACRFIGFPETNPLRLKEKQDLQNSYEQQGGDKLYFVALLVALDFQTQPEIAAAYKKYCGFVLNLDVLNRINSKWTSIK